MHPDLLQFLTVTMAAFLLVFFRTTGLVMSAPLLSSQTFPVTLRIWTAFWITGLVFPIVRQQLEPDFFLAVFRTPATMAVAVFSEVVLGWTVGFVASALLHAFQVAGHLIGQEIGLSIGEIFDPVSQSVGSPTTNLLYTVGVVVFLIGGGYRLILNTMVRTFSAAPPGGCFGMNGETQSYLVEDVASSMWHEGVTLALPVIIALLLATVAMAIMARTVPEMNIFILGFSLRIGLGLFVFFMLVPFIVEFMGAAVSHTDELLAGLLVRMGGG